MQVGGDLMDKSILYGIIAGLVGIIVGIFVANYAVNTRNYGMMNMMGMKYMMQQNEFGYQTEDDSKVNSRNMNVSMNMMTRELEDYKGDEFDKAFIELMIEHHQGAIDMANLIPSRTNHEELRNMGEDIVSVQSAEIEMMNGWLKDWFK
jgi:uncharacterized protein (DUF305 family)